MGDGHLGKCKICTKADVAQHRAKNINKIRAYDRNRGNRRPLEHSYQYRKQFPERAAAMRAIAYAISKGSLDRPIACWYCGSGFCIEAHHSSYAKDMKLDVTWLCAACHKGLHLGGTKP